MIRAIGFDLDGTLFDHRGAARRGVADFLTARGVTVTDVVVNAWFESESEHFERWRRGLIDFAEQRRERLRDVLPGLGLELPGDDAGLDAIFDDYLSAYRAAWAVFPGTRDLLHGLRRRGYRLGLLTNGSAVQQSEKLDRLGLTDVFDVTLISEQIGHQKPEREAFAALVSGLGVPPGECLFVGDDPKIGRAHV